MRRRAPNVPVGATQHRYQIFALTRAMVVMLPIISRQSGFSPLAQQAGRELRLAGATGTLPTQVSQVRNGCTLCS